MLQLLLRKSQNRCFCRINFLKCRCEEGRIPIKHLKDKHDEIFDRGEMLWFCMEWAENITEKRKSLTAVRIEQAKKEELSEISALLAIITKLGISLLVN